jgi:hypothetical protein
MQHTWVIQFKYSILSYNVIYLKLRERSSNEATDKVQFFQ